MKWAWKHKPKLARLVAKSLTYDNENGKQFWPRVPPVSRMLIVLGAPCLSEHICTKAGPTFLRCLSCLCSVLRLILLLPLRLYGLYAAYGEAYQGKPSCIPSHQSQSKVWITCLCCPHNCLISSEYNSVTKRLEWCFTTFIDLDFKPLVCFEECINQSDWHQQAFHWVQKKREPLKIARLGCNELL